MKTPALRIEINDELLAIAGAEDLSLLSGQVGFGAGKDEVIDLSHVMFSAMGIDIRSSLPRQLSWGAGVRLKLGDRVTFQIVEVELPSEPDRISRTPSSSELASASARTGDKPDQHEPGT